MMSILMVSWNSLENDVFRKLGAKNGLTEAFFVLLTREKKGCIILWYRN